MLMIEIALSEVESKSTINKISEEGDVDDSTVEEGDSINSIAEDESKVLLKRIPRDLHHLKQIQDNRE